MKYVVFSDIHGNQYTMRKMLHDTSGRVDGYLFLGDVSGYYYGQLECMDMLKSLPPASILIKGNHDVNYMTSRTVEDLMSQFAHLYSNSCLKNFGPDYVSWLAGLPLHRETEIDGRKVGLFHGSPWDYENGRVYPDADLSPEDYTKYDVVFLGHTHYRMVRRMYGTLIINPGSLGQPRDGRGFSYVIFDFETMEYEFCKVKFTEEDRAALFTEIERHEESAKNETYLKSVLLRGEN